MLTETISLTTDLEQAYFQYAVETITDRALPRVEDGLKPVQRRILFTMHNMNLRHDRPHRKSARVVGDCLGRYHPHGDQSIYLAMVRMGQEFSMRAPLIDGQGNFGCFTGDTKVKLLDGTDRSFEELSQMYDPDQIFYVYSVDSDGNVVVGEGRHSRVTRQNAQVIELELDNGETIRCTPDHRFMLRDGTYKQAQDLTEDDSLMPGYFSTAPIREGLNDYLQVLHPGSKTYEFVHHLADRYNEERGNVSITFDDFDEFLTLSATYNHRIVAKRVLTERVDVYDITVEPYHNFLLGSGVFVHNSIDGDAPAAMRYTEARLAAISDYMLQDIDQDTVDMMDNFDSSLQEPVILPAAVPNLLVNGTTGIAVGMATNIPPHNLGEVCDAVIHVASNWRGRAKITVDDLLDIVPGPDFPTGGVLYRYRTGPEGEQVDTIRAAYETGRGRIVTQARVDLEDIGGGKANIVVTELPYAVQKSTVLERIAREVRDGKIAGVTDLRDESDHEGMRVIVEVSRVADAREVLESVLSRSQLRETFGVNALALVAEGVNGETVVRPQRLSLLDMLIYFVDHRLTVVVRRTKHELAKREARLHIVQGLLKALDVIDQVIDTIRRSRTSETAEANLIKKFGFTQIQAQAILAMQLRRLAALERRKLVDEEKELQARIKYLKGLLRSEKRRLEVVVEETKAIKDQFTTPRKTVILTTEKPGDTIVTEAELAMPDGPQVIALTTQGLQRQDAKQFSYRVRPGATSRAVEAHRLHVQTEPTDTVVLVSDRGHAWWGAVGRLPRSASPGELGLAKGEQVVGIDVLTPGCTLFVGTRQGRVKRVKAEDVQSSAEASWAPIVGLDKDDGVLFAGTGGDKAQVMFFTNARVNRFAGDAVNPQATPSARGVAAIKVPKGDRLLGGGVVSEPGASWAVVVVSQGGYVKRIPLKEFPVQGRGGQGVQVNQGQTAGPTVAVALGDTKGAVDLLSANGRRQRLDKVPSSNRTRRGKKLVELEDVVEVAIL